MSRTGTAVDTAVSVSYAAAAGIGVDGMVGPAPAVLLGLLSRQARPGQQTDSSSSSSSRRGSSSSSRVSCRMCVVVCAVQHGAGSLLHAGPDGLQGELAGQPPEQPLLGTHCRPLECSCIARTTSNAVCMLLDDTCVCGMSH
jgi:hypothetical protein